MAFLEAIVKEDLMISVGQKDFVTVQSMRERFSQTVSYRTAFGSAHPIIRSVTPSDSSQISFSFLLLKAGVQKGLNSYKVFKNLEDFEIHTHKGTQVEAYPGCNWTDIDIDSQQDGVTVSMDVVAPGFTP